MIVRLALLGGYAALAEELVEMTLFDDAAFFQDEDLVHGTQRRKAVGDANHGTVFGEVIDRLLHLGGMGNLAMGRHRADAHTRAVDLDAFELCDGREVDQVGRIGQALLQGRHLIDAGYEPGPQMGTLLRRVYEMQLDGKVTTLEEALAAARAIDSSASNRPARFC